MVKVQPARVFAVFRSDVCLAKTVNDINIVKVSTAIMADPKSMRCYKPCGRIRFDILDIGVHMSLSVFMNCQSCVKR